MYRDCAAFTEPSLLVFEVDESTNDEEPVKDVGEDRTDRRGVVPAKDRVE